MANTSNLLRKQVASEMRKRRLIFYTVILLSFIYLFVSLVFGESGFLRYKKLHHTKVQLESQIQAIQEDNQSVEEAKQGAEVAVSVDGITIGRQAKGGDILYTDIPAEDAKKLRDMEVLTLDEKDVLEKIFEIKRKTEKFWGM